MPSAHNGRARQAGTRSYDVLTLPRASARSPHLVVQTQRSWTQSTPVGAGTSQQRLCGNANGQYRAPRVRRARVDGPYLAKWRPLVRRTQLVRGRVHRVNCSAVRASVRDFGRLHSGKPFTGLEYRQMWVCCFGQLQVKRLEIGKYRFACLVTCFNQCLLKSGIVAE